MARLGGSIRGGKILMASIRLEDDAPFLLSDVGGIDDNCS
ncbi:unnamed protein product [marine sediment metagenome]|uniref:Uncharacterized protein n=1 Tax=marine sediment metagenome TaxID=412755 RepID=X0V1G6_9ZZZZ